MEVCPHPTGSYMNLRVFQGASTLATDLFWITRRFPPDEQHALTAQLRRAARAICRNVILAWNQRYCGLAFCKHIDEAQSACARLSLGLDAAHTSGYLADSPYEALTACQRNVQRLLSRLEHQRIVLLD